VGEGLSESVGRGRRQEGAREAGVARRVGERRQRGRRSVTFDSSQRPTSDRSPFSTFRSLRSPSTHCAISDEWAGPKLKVRRRSRTKFDAHMNAGRSPSISSTSWAKALQPPKLTARTTDPPEKVAAKLRAMLEVTLARQRQWNSEYTAFGNWRDAIEDSGILVFQTSGVPVSEARGLSISVSRCP